MKKNDTELEKNSRITVIWGAGAAAFAGYRTFQNFPELFWPPREKRSVLQITTKEEILLSLIHKTLIKRKAATTLDSYLRVIQEYYTITEKLQSETILRDDLDFNQPLLWSNVTDLSSRLINLRNAICILTSKHYNDDSLKELFTNKEETSPSVDVSLKKEFFNDCDNLIKFFQLIHNYQSSKLAVELFTTNYDVFLEHLFWFKKEYNFNQIFEEWDFDNGFYVDEQAYEVDYKATDNNLKINGKIPWYIGDESQAVYCKKMGDNFRKKAYKKTDTKHSLRVNRLHGFVGWIRANIGEKEIFFSIAPLKSFKSYHDRLCVCYPGHEDSLGNPPHIDSWRKFSIQLNKSHICIIVGFAFRDPDILNAIGRRLEISDRPFRIIVIDPHISSKEPLLRRLIDISKDYCPPLPYWEKLLDKEGAISFISSRFPLGEKGLQELEESMKSIVRKG